MSNINILFDNEYVLNVKLNETEFVQRWKTLLQQELDSKEILQLDTFSCFLTKEESRQHLRSAIDTVNKYLKTTFIELPTDEELADPIYYNFLHIQFEKLAGSDWDKPTKLMVVAPKDVKLAIRHINRFCHKLESSHNDLTMRVEFDTIRREPLSDSDYDLFVPTLEDGNVYLDYSTLGKSLYECFEDNLDPAYAGLKLQQHYTANFILRFGGTHGRSNQDFNNWLEQHGVDRASVKGSGHIHLGHITNTNPLEYVRKSRTINKIILE